MKSYLIEKNGISHEQEHQARVALQPVSKRVQAAATRTVLAVKAGILN